MDDALAIQARRRGVPKAALIREYLSQHVEARRPGVDDPSARLIGSYDGGDGESASVNATVYR